MGVEHRKCPWNPLERTVRVPKAVRQSAEPPPCVLLPKGTLVAQVGHIGDFGAEPGFLVVSVSVSKGLQGAKMLRKGDLLTIGQQRIAVENEHGIPVYALPKGLQRGVVQGCGQIDTAHFAGEQRMNLTEIQSHRSLQANRVTRMAFRCRNI